MSSSKEKHNISNWFSGICCFINRIVFVLAVIVVVLAVSFASLSFIRNSNYISYITESVSNKIQTLLIDIKGVDVDIGQNGIVDNPQDIQYSADIYSQTIGSQYTPTSSEDFQSDICVQNTDNVIAHIDKAEIDQILLYEKQMYELENQLTSTNLLSFIYAFLSGILIAVSTKRLSDTEKHAKKAEDAARKAGNISSNIELFANSMLSSVYLSVLNNISLEVQHFQIEWLENKKKTETEKSKISAAAITRLHDLIVTQLNMVISKSDALQECIGMKSSSFSNQIVSEVQILQKQIANAFEPVKTNPAVEVALKIWEEQLQKVKNSVSKSKRKNHL